MTKPLTKPWTDGPRELLQHAMDHLSLGGDFDRRIAMISVDNAVELMIKTHLGLPRRARDGAGPSRKELEAASESFPDLLDLLDKYESERVTGLSLDDIEWYHRLRNQLYHAGNGITVEASKVEAYFQLAASLFEGLFQMELRLDGHGALQTRTGKFLLLWNEFERKLRAKLPPKQGELAFYWKRGFLENADPAIAGRWEAAAQFRSLLVHGPDTPNAAVIDQHIKDVRDLIAAIDALN